MTKHEIAAALAERGIILKPSQIRKSTAQALQARLDAAGGPAPPKASATAPANDEAQPRKRRGTYAAPKGEY